MQTRNAVPLLLLAIACSEPTTAPEVKASANDLVDYSWSYMVSDSNGHGILFGAETGDQCESTSFSRYEKIATQWLPDSLFEFKLRSERQVPVTIYDGTDPCDDSAKIDNGYGQFTATMVTDHFVYVDSMIYIDLHAVLVSGRKLHLHVRKGVATVTYK